MFKNAAQVLLELRDRAYLKLGEVVLDTMRREPPAARQQQALHIFRASLRWFINQTTHNDEFLLLLIGETPGLGAS